VKNKKIFCFTINTGGLFEQYGGFKEKKKRGVAFYAAQKTLKNFSN
jgi:hypothetical protein